MAATAAPLKRVSAQTTSTLAFSDRFDTVGKKSFVPPWTEQSKAAPGAGGDPLERLLTVANPARSGSGALRLHVNDADVSPYTYTENPRAQVQKTDLFAPGSEWYIGTSYYFPADFPALPSGHWLIFTSFGFRSPWNGSAPGKYSRAFRHRRHPWRARRRDCPAVDWCEG